MPKVAKGKRKRAYRPKTKSGCLTCRIRRVKCDETRPACLKCTSTRRACDGYYHVQPPQLLHSNIVPVIADPSFDIHASPKSNRSFAFFVQRTSSQLAGFFGSEFWERLVLQAAYHESAVRHAIVAIGSLHELLEHQIAIKDADRTFALEQYNLAIRDLLVPLSQSGERDVDICLISCILFTCFENMQGNHALAGLHIQSGAKLLRETVYDQRNRVLQHQVLGSKSHAELYAPLEVLAKFFAGLDSQVTMMTGDSKFKRYESYFSGTAHTNISLSFSSIQEAKEIFEYGSSLFTNSHAVQLSSDPMHFQVAIEANIDHFATLLSKFSIALQILVESKTPSFTPKEDIAVAVLQLHVLSTYVSLHVEYLPPNSRLRWDEFMPQIKEMVILGEKIVSFTSAENNHGGKPTSFCLDMGFVIPLYNVASQCRDPIIRRKVIGLLRSTSRQEGLWNSLLAAKVAERIMEIEESMLGEMIANNDGLDLARSSIQPIFELDKRGGRLKYFRQKQGTDTQINVIEEVFSWSDTRLSSIHLASDFQCTS